MDRPLAISPGAGWLRGPAFDGLFIAGVLGVALLSGLIVTLRPDWFYPVLFVDLWLLGFPHVISTFTRLTFDRESFDQHRFLVLGLPWMILIGTVALGALVGPWSLTTLYFYWQWFHYTRQSYGVTRIYSRKAGAGVESEALWIKMVVYLVPLWGILNRSHQHQEKFLGLEMRYLPIPGFLVDLVGAAAAAAVLVLLVRQVRAWRSGRFPLALNLFLLSHIVVFVVGYQLIADVSQGWLVVNVWHNAQYIMIVWTHNNRRFQNGVDAKHRFLSLLSQGRPRNMLLYFGLIFTTGTLIYWGMAMLGQWMVLPLITLVAYQTVNFHHYVVDALIWRARKPGRREALRLRAS